MTQKNYYKNFKRFFLSKISRSKFGGSLSWKVKRRHNTYLITCFRDEPAELCPETTDHGGDADLEHDDPVSVGPQVPGWTPNQTPGSEA